MSVLSCVNSLSSNVSIFVIGVTVPDRTAGPGLLAGRDLHPALPGGRGVGPQRYQEPWLQHGQVKKT